MIGAVLRQQLLDAVPRVEQVAQGLIVVERRDDERHVFAHVRLAEPRAFEHLFGGIGQVRGEHVYTVTLVPLNLPFKVFTMLFSSFRPNTHMGILLSLARMEAVISTT